MSCRQTATQTRGPAPVVGGVTSRAAVAAFLQDAARAGVSMWTVVNVLRVWVADGTQVADIAAAVERAKELLPSHEPLLTEYQLGIDHLLG